jgi:hypothetical protein
MSNEFGYRPSSGPLAGWVVTAHYEVVAGRLVINYMRIVPSDENAVPANGITGQLLKSIRPSRLMDWVKVDETEWLDWLEARLEEVPEDQRNRHDDLKVAYRLRDEARTLTSAPRAGPTGKRGTPRLADDYLRGLAALHIDEIDADGSWGAVTRLAESLDKPYETIKDQLAKARKRDLYPKPMDETDREETL